MRKLNLSVPSYNLPDLDIFSVRDKDWEDSITQNILTILGNIHELGFVAKHFSIDRPDKVDKSELKKTNYKIINMIIAHGTKEINLSYNVPWLVDNHFMIGGNRKIGIFQLFDMPVIYRDNLIKFRSNIQTINVEKKSTRGRKYKYYTNIFNKSDIPFVFFIYAKYKEDGKLYNEFPIDEEGNITLSVDEYVSDDYRDLLSDISIFLKSDDFDKNKLLSKYFNRKTDQSLVENIELISTVDIFTRKYMMTNDPISEIVHHMKIGMVPDINYADKRIRFSEHIIYCHICKDIYNMITTLKGSNSGRFCNNSKSIINGINRSPIVQFDFSLNPLSELAMLTRLSLSGPGGFDKSNVPVYLRDIHKSMFGRVCPADTGDRDNCGTVQYLTPSADFSDNMSLSKSNEKCVNSIAISHVPFLEHDDPTRLQMSSSQQRHAVMLKKFDVPYIQSGVEGMYTDNTSFIMVAERDGTVVFRDDNVIIIQYDNKVCKACNIGYKKLYLTLCDFYKVNFEVGDEFKKDDIIAESNYLKDGRLTIGRNLNTAVMIYHGYNYEDGLVISDRLVKDEVFTSIHYLNLILEIPRNKVLLNINGEGEEYKPLPQVGDSLVTGQTYAKIKSITGTNDSLVEMIFDQPSERVIQEDGIVTDVQIYANKWNKDFPQYDKYIRESVAKIGKRKEQLKENLSKYLTEDELERFLDGFDLDRTEKVRGTYKIKGESIDGILIEITAIYKRNIEVGDKIGNRHGNKGVISAIVPEKDMPITEETGERADVIINPLGIISRMNLGQLYELHLSQAVKDFISTVRKNIKDGWSWVDIKTYTMGFIKIIDKTEDGNYYDQMKSYMDSISLDEFKSRLSEFYIIQPPYESVQIDDLNTAMEYTDSDYEVKMKNPNALNFGLTNCDIVNKIAFGSMYWLKLNHIAKDKIAYRGVGPYSMKTCQPLEGKSRKGGQRAGEMEFWALAAHGATLNIEEFMTTKSDSIKKRNKYISEMLHNDDMLLDQESDDVVSQSVRLFQALLMSIGLDYKVEETPTS